MAKLVTPDGKQLNIFLNLDDSDDGNGANPLKYGSKNHSGMNFVVSAFRNFKTNYGTCVKLVFHNSSGEMELDITSLISTNPSSASKMTVVSGTSVYFIEDDLLLETTSGKITRIDIYEASPDIVTELDSRVFTLESQDTSKPNFVAIDSSGYQDFMLLTDKGTLYKATPYKGQSADLIDDYKGRNGLMGMSPFVDDVVQEIYDSDYSKIYRDSTIKFPKVSKDDSFTEKMYVSGRHYATTTSQNWVFISNAYFNRDVGSKIEVNFDPVEKVYLSQENHGTYQWAIRVFVKKLDGYIYGKGYNNTGALGTGDGVYAHWEFQQITDIGTNPKYLGNHGALYGCLVVQKSDGTILVCGSNASGQLGNGSTSQLNYLTDVTSNWIPSGTNKSDWTIVKSFGGFGERDNGTSGAVLGMWLKHNDGTDIIRMCGWGGNGALGHNSNSNSTTPVTAFQGHQIRQVEWYGSVYGGVMVVTEDDKLYGWGRNSEYQLGLGHKNHVSNPIELFVVYPEILAAGQPKLDTSTDPSINILVDEYYANNGYRNHYFSDSDTSIPLNELPRVKRIVCCKGPSQQTYKLPIFIEDTVGLIYVSGYNINGEAGIGADNSNIFSNFVNEPANFSMHKRYDVSGQYSKFWRRVLFPIDGRYWWDYHPNYTGPKSKSDKFPNIKFISPCFSTTVGKTSYVAITEDNEIYCWGFNGNDSFWNQSDVHSNILSPTLLNKNFHIK